MRAWIVLAVTLAALGCDDGDAGRGDAGPSAAAAAPPGVCTVAEVKGGPCDGNSDCLPGLRCIEDKCAQDALEDQPCDTTGDCVGGLFCARVDAQGRALPTFTCQPTVGPDAPCRPENSGICGELRCIHGACVGRTPMEGGPCDSSLDCAQRDHYCDPAQVAEDGLPGVCTARLAEGAVCAENDECFSGGGCREGRCRAYYTGAVQAPCAGNADCERALYCDQAHADGSPRATGVCAVTAQRGEPCDVWERFGCEHPGVCAEGTCVEAVEEGGACRFGLGCAEGLRCVE